MVDLARPSARQLILAEHVRNTSGLLLGDVGYGQLVRLVDVSDTASYSVVLGNKDTTNGLAVKIQYGDHAGTPTTLATFAKAAITVTLPLTVKQAASLSDPAATYTTIGARTSDGRPVFRAAGGSETAFALTTDSVALSTFMTAGDIVQATGAGAIARLGIGTARQNLQVNAGATALAYAASLQSLMTGIGDIVQSSGANTPARLAIGTARQTLLVNAGATALAYGESLQSLLTTQGDLPYALSANTPARLARGSDGQVLTLASGLPSWATNAATSVAHRNMMVNGTGRTKQRTTLATTDNAYGFDRWRLLLENANGATMTQETSDLPAPGPGYAMKLIVGSGNNGKFGHWQPLLFADCRNAAGDVVSLQAKLKVASTSGTSDIRMAVAQFVGTADSISGDPVATWGAAGTVPTLAANWSFANTPANLSVTTSWATYKVEGIAISASAVNLAVMIWDEDRTTTQTTDYLLMTDIQLELGSTSTDVERISGYEEKLRCLEWLEVLGGTTTTEAAGSGHAYAAGTALIALRFATKRVAPVFSVSANSHWALVDGSGGLLAATNNVFSNIGLSSCGITVTVASGLTAGNGTTMIANSTASARIFIVAEP